MRMMISGGDAHRDVIPHLLCFVGFSSRCMRLCCLFAGRNFLHAVEGTARLEPADLLFVEGVIEIELFGFAVGMLDLAAERLARSKRAQA